MQRGRLFILILAAAAAQIIKVGHGDVPISRRQPPHGDVLSLGKLPPVILIPPVGGSKLEASVSRKDSVSPFCKLEGDDNVWFDMSNFIPGLIDCWEEEMRLNIDANASLASGEQIEAEPDGVNVHTTKYGDPREGIAELGGTTLFDGVIDQLHHLGYRDNHNMFAAPFDWRRGPGHWINHDWKKLRDFVEQTVQKAGGTPAIFVSASFGGTYLSSFLLHAQGVDEQWKQRHVSSLVALSSPFAGVPAALGALLWGDPLPSMDGLGGGIDLGDARSFLPRASVKSLVNTWGTAFWLLPQDLLRQEIEEEPLVALPPSWGANLTLRLLRDMWRVTGRNDALALLDIGTRYPAVHHPGVKVYCLFGAGTPSPVLYGYGPVTTGASEVTPTEGGAESLASMFSSAVAEVAAAMAPEAPTRPPPGSSVGDAAWLHSVASLFEARMPDTVEAASGDGLVATRSLAVCERWAVDAPELPAPTVVQVEGMKHGLDLFNKGVLRQLGQLLDKAIKSEIRGSKDSAPASAARPPIRDPEAMQGQQGLANEKAKEGDSKGGGSKSKQSASVVAAVDKPVAEIASSAAAPQTFEKSPRVPPTSQIIEGVWWSARTVIVAGAVFVAGATLTLAVLLRTSSKRSVAFESEQMVPLQDLGDFLAESEMPSERPGSFPSWSPSTHDEAYQSLAA